MTSRLIGSGPIRPPVRPSKGQSGVLQAIDHSVTGSMTAQPPGIRPSALRVATQGQQVASLGMGSYPSEEVQSAYSTAPADRAEIFQVVAGRIMATGVVTGYIYIYIYIRPCKPDIPALK